MTPQSIENSRLPARKGLDPKPPPVGNPVFQNPLEDGLLVFPVPLGPAVPRSRRGLPGWVLGLLVFFLTCCPTIRSTV